jgi:hypothetical protein
MSGQSSDRVELTNSNTSPCSLWKMIQITATEIAEQNLCTLLSYLNHSIHTMFPSAPSVRRRSSEGVQFLAFTTFTSKPTPSFCVSPICLSFLYLLTKSDSHKFAAGSEVDWTPHEIRKLFAIQPSAHISEYIQSTHSLYILEVAPVMVN